MTSDPAKALFIYQKTVELYPESAYALSSVAKAKANADVGDINKAVTYKTEALEK